MLGQRPRVLHVINNLAVGGAESVLVGLASELRDRFDQSVICILDRGVLADRLDSIGVRVETLGVSPRLPNPLAVLTLAGRIRAIGPDIVQTWLYQSDLVGGLAARMAGVRNVVWNLRSTDLSPGRTHPLTRVIARICAGASSYIPAQIVCCAESVATVHRQIGYDSGRMTVIPNGVNLDRFRPDPACRSAVRTELDVAPETLLVGHLARLDPQKDHETLFAAAKILRQARPDVQFVLAGQRILKENPTMQALRKKYAIDAGFHFLGERHDVPRLLAALDVVTLSSWGEGYPNVLCEAMASCVPCVSTDVGDAKLIIGDCGRIVERRNPAALASAWLDLLSLDKTARGMVGRAARDHVARHFDQRASTEKYAQLYSDLVAKER